MYRLCLIRMELDAVAPDVPVPFSALCTACLVAPHGLMAQKRKNTSPLDRAPQKEHPTATEQAPKPEPPQ